MLRSTLLLVVLLLVSASAEAQGQSTVPDSLRGRLVRAVRPVPSGVRIRSIQRPRRVVIIGSPSGATVPGAAAGVPATGSPATPTPAATAPVFVSNPGVSAAELAALEARLRAQIDARTAEILALQRAAALREPPVLPIPLGQGLNAGVSDASDTLMARPAPGPGVVQPADPLVPISPSREVIERLIVETGLFRSVNVIFEVNSRTLLPHSFETLNSVADVLVRHPEIRIRVEGHTDSTGGDDYNQALSEARAASVVDYLLTRGVFANQLTSMGRGESAPIADNGHSTGRTLNRRVEFVVTDRTR